MAKHHLEKVVFYMCAYGITFAVLFLFFTKQSIDDDSFSFLRIIVLVLFIPVLFKYFLQLSIAPWFEAVYRLKQKRCSNISYTPMVSVLIPAWNEEVGVINTVRSLLESQYKNMEIIVINDGSTDRTHDVMVEFLKKCEKNIPIVYRYKKNGGKAKALNLGLKIARGEIIVTIDADSIVDSGAISHMVKHFSDARVMSVAGNVKIGNRIRIIGLVQQLEYLYGFYFKKADSLMNSIYIVGGAAAAYRRSIFHVVGVFDEQIITEDIEMSTRIQNAGYKIEYAPEAIVYTEGPTELDGLFKQRLRWKYGRFLTFYKYRKLFFSIKSIHSRPLTILVLPIAFFAEILLFFEWILLVIFYGYTFYANDYLPIVINMILVTCVVLIQILTDTKRRWHANLFVLAPIAWCLFYFIDFVEYQALVRSIARIVRGQGVTWQRWNRSGVFEKT